MAAAPRSDNETESSSHPSDFEAGPFYDWPVADQNAVLGDHDKEVLFKTAIQHGGEGVQVYRISGNGKVVPLKITAHAHSVQEHKEPGEHLLKNVPHRFVITKEQQEAIDF